VTVLRRQLVRSDFERMNLPRGFWRARIQGVQESMRDVVRRYLVNIDTMCKRGAGMLLSGNPGVGKTAIAALVAKESRMRGYTVYFTTIWELRECVRNRIDFEDGKSVLQRCREVDVLILDELGLEDVKDYHFDIHALEQLVKARAAQRRVTVITTRLDSDKLLSSMSGLMNATQGCMVPLRVAGIDLRQQQSEELNELLLGSQ
jgi:DNA replication protein DnaC